jgi:hypothetical protein
MESRAREMNYQIFIKKLQGFYTFLSCFLLSACKPLHIFYCKKNAMIMPEVSGAMTPNLAAKATRHLEFVQPCSKPEKNTYIILCFCTLSIIIFNEVLHFRSQLCFYLRISFQNAVSLKIQLQSPKEDCQS